MELVTPGIGLLVWMSITFGLVFLILRKTAWKPILGIIQEREASIDAALKAADEAQKKMASLNAENEQLLTKARIERDAILKEAREMRDKVISDAKASAEEEGKKLIARSYAEIEKQKSNAMSELKKQVASISIEIAEKLVSQKLSGNSEEQNNLINQHLNNIESSQRATSNN